MMNKQIKKLLKTIIPILLSGFILFWVYRDFDFTSLKEVLNHEMNWFWMFVSCIFGVFSHIFRGWRWRQTLEPLGFYPSRQICVLSIFVSYATNLILPRIGEISRCGVLKKYSQVPFAQSVGTVVTERIIDSICILLIALTTFLCQMPMFYTFFNQTGVKMPEVSQWFTSPTFYIILLGSVVVITLLFYFVRALSVFRKVKGVIAHVWEGITSLRNIKDMPRFILYTIAIWTCYFLHFYLTFFCFGFTEHLGLWAALVMFVGGTFAVLVPTPNGAGPWHFAIITLLVLYGINNVEAQIFALIVHTIQTFLVALLGVYGFIALALISKKSK